MGLICSYAANEAEPDGLLGEEFDSHGLDQSSREFLADAIQDYNDLFGTSFDTSGERFGNYYKDLSLRLKNRELDVVIVVNMFLTGFDATTLNTLWVDKNLRAHGLVQAFSRTNRILNSVKTYGNIVSFRNLEDQTNDALALFGNTEAQGVVLLKPYREYYQEYAEQVSELLDGYPPGELIAGEENQRRFIALLGTILRLLNILTAFDDFAGDEILTPPASCRTTRASTPTCTPNGAKSPAPTRRPSTTTSCSRSSRSNRSRSTSITSWCRSASTWPNAASSGT